MLATRFRSNNHKKTNVVPKNNNNSYRFIVLALKSMSQLSKRDNTIVHNTDSNIYMEKCTEGVIKMSGVLQVFDKWWLWIRCCLNQNVSLKIFLNDPLFCWIFY